MAPAQPSDRMSLCAPADPESRIPDPHPIPDPDRLSRPGLLFAALLGLGLLALPAAAAPHVTRLVVAVEGPYVRVTFDLAEAVEQALLTRIESGIPSGFVYEIELLRDRKRLWDALVDEAELAVTANYDPVARTYLVRYELDGRLIDSRSARGRAELERALTHVDSLPVFEAAGLIGETRHIVAVRAEIGSDAALGVFPRALRTPWIESRKFRIPDRRR